MHCHTCMLQHQKSIVWYQGHQVLGQPSTSAILRRCKYDCNLSLLETLAKCMFTHEFEFAYAKLRLTDCDIYSSLDMGSECNNLITNALLYLYVVTPKICCLVSRPTDFGTPGGWVGSTHAQSLQVCITINPTRKVFEVSFAIIQYSK